LREKKIDYRDSPENFVFDKIFELFPIMLMDTAGVVRLRAPKALSIYTGESTETYIKHSEGEPDEGDRHAFHAARKLHANGSTLQSPEALSVAFPTMKTEAAAATW
jgi:hypothetical protein